MKHALDTTGFLWARCELTELGAWILPGEFCCPPFGVWGVLDVP
jgi:hypothetical protein